MIKVNLLASTAGAAPTREWLPREQRSALVGLGLLVVTALGVGGWWYYLRSERNGIDARIEAAETELVRLREAATLVDETMAHRTELAERLGLIDRLRLAKREPVNLLEAVSRSIPEGLWLIELKQSGTSVQIDGRAMSLTSLTDFAGRMQTSGLFQHPVEILSTTTESVEENEVVRFSIKADALTPPAPTATPAGTTLPAAAPAAAPGSGV